MCTHWTNSDVLNWKLDQACDPCLPGVYLHIHTYTWAHSQIHVDTGAHTYTYNQSYAHRSTNTNTHTPVSHIHIICSTTEMQHQPATIMSHWAVRCAFILEACVPFNSEVPSPGSLLLPTAWLPFGSSTWLLYIQHFQLFLSLMWD